MELETVLIAILACVFLLLVMVGAYCLDCLLEQRKVRLLEDYANEVVTRAQETLEQDFENIKEWLDAAEKIKIENEAQLEDLKQLHDEIRNMRHRKRDQLGRFTKKG